ncbi:hypothetical protein M4D79_19420 [Mycolicibacterium novocastrense]|nr:hypothetical protein M4D79_19420 [Mycolicibacterium novocastrense]
MHEHDIRDALGRPASDPTGTPAVFALDEMAASMRGFVVRQTRRGATTATGVDRADGASGQDHQRRGRGGAEEVVGDYRRRRITTATITLDALLFAQLAGLSEVALDHDLRSLTAAMRLAGVSSITST